MDELDNHVEELEKELENLRSLYRATPSNNVGRRMKLIDDADFLKERISLAKRFRDRYRKIKPPRVEKSREEEIKDALF